jgi:type II secretory pathway component PulF
VAMKKFKYTAVDPKGSIVKGEQEASYREDVVFELKAKGFTLLDLKESDTDGQPSKSKPTKLPSFHFRGRVTPAVIAEFTRQLAELTEAGIPIVEALDSISEHSTSEKFRIVTEKVSADLQRGMGLAQAFAEQPQCFSPLFVNMIKVGEAGGNVPEMVARLATYLEHDLELRSRIRSALSYPAFTLATSLILVYFSISFLLPGFIPVFEGANLDMSQYPITVFLIKLSNMTESVWDELLLLFILSFIVYLFRAILKTPEAARASDRFVYSLPVIGSFIELTVMARVANTLGALIEGGVPLSEAFDLTAGTSGRITIDEALTQVSKRVQEGAELSVALRETEAFPGLMVQMISLGEKSGELNVTLTRVAQYYQRKLDAGINSLSSLLQPIIMVFIGGLIFVFVLGIFLPILGVAGSIT